MMESLWVYLSCEIQFSEDKKKAWLGQPLLNKSLEKKFSEQVKKSQSPKTLGIPQFLIIRQIDDAEKDSVEDQRLFQSGIS